MAFDLASATPVEEKPGFDLVSASPVTPPSKLDSAILGAGQGASLGFGDEGAAGVETLAKAAKDLFGGKVDPAALMDYYRKSRDQIRGNIDASQKENPKTFMAGQFAGAAATAPLIGEATIPKLAALGAIQGLGNSKADLTQGDIGGAAKDAVIGGIVGAGTGAVAKGVGAALDPENWSSAAKAAALKALGYTKRFLNTPGKQAAADTAAQTMLDKGVITPFASPDQMSERVSNLLGDTGEKIGDFLKSQGKGYDPQTAIDAINSLRPTDDAGRMLSGGHYDKINGIIDSAIDTIKAHGSNIESDVSPMIPTQKDNILPFTEANKIKGFLQDMVNWNSTSGEADTGKAIAGAMRGTVDKSLDNISGGGPDFENFLQNKEVYKSGLEAQDALANRLSSEQGNKPVGLTDTILGAGMAGGELAAGHLPIGAAAAVGAKKIAEKYGGTATAWGADKVAKGLNATSDTISKILQTSPEQLGKYAGILGNAAAQSSQALAVRHFVLSNTDPEYRVMIRKLEDKQ